MSLLAPTDESVGMLRALAIELATGAWADQLAVTLVGFGGELPDLFAPGCLVYEDALARAVDALAEWSARVEDILDKRDVSLREARTYPDDELAAVTKTHMLLSAIPLDGPSAYRLRQILSGRQRTSVAVVALIRDSDHLLSPWAVTGRSFRTPQTQTGGPGLRVRMQALRDDQYSAIVRDLSGVDLDDEWEQQQQALAEPSRGHNPRRSPRPSHRHSRRTASASRSTTSSAPKRCRRPRIRRRPASASSRCQARRARPGTPSTPRTCRSSTWS